MSYTIARTASPVTTNSALLQDRRAQVRDFLDAASAARMAEAVSTIEFATTLNTEKRVVDLSPAQLAAMTGAQRDQLGASVVQAAVDQYRFLFCTARASDEGEPYPDPAHPLAEIVAFFTGQAFLDFCRSAFARPDIAFADVRATLYQPGHFLHMHTDAQEGKNRVGAYVYNLAPRWRPEWGGALTFPTPDGDIAAAYIPRFNSLNLLQVPQPHYVSYVAPFAGAPRLAITGWVRTG